MNISPPIPKTITFKFIHMKTYKLRWKDSEWTFDAICFLSAFNKAKMKYEQLGLIGRAYLVTSETTVSFSC